MASNSFFIEQILLSVFFEKYRVTFAIVEVIQIDCTGKSAVRWRREVNV